jgi:hypothetical protein
MVCLRNISVDTLHKGDTDDDDDNNDNNNKYNNNNNSKNRPNTGLLSSVVLHKFEICWGSFLHLVGVRGQDCQAENIQLILDLPALGITKPLKKITEFMAF